MNIFVAELDTQKNEFNFLNKYNNYYETDKYIITILGNISIKDKINNYSDIITLFEQYYNEIVNHIEGLYYLIIFDKSNNTLSIYQDYFTSYQVLYYTKKDKKIFFSNNLQTLLSFSAIDRRMNKNVYIEFLKFGFIKGNETLIKNVYKIPAFNMLKINENNIYQIEIPYKFNEKSTIQGVKSWCSVLDRAIEINTPLTSEFSLPLSGGFDSNYLLYHYNSKYPEKKINLFTIGGNTGIDETENVRKIVKSYGNENHRLTICYTSKHMFLNLPDIVWRLGGCVYERGIFLQYKLASELKNTGIKDLICGECADQVMDERFYKAGILKEYENLQGKKNPYNFAAYIILKKSGILLNSFGITGHYPYTNQHFVETANSVGSLNKTTKIYHIKKCREIIPAKTSKYFNKNGGSTLLHTLFENDKEIHKFLKAIENSSLYKKYNLLLSYPKGSAKNLQKFNEKIKILLNIKLLFKSFVSKIKVQKVNTITPKYLKTEKRINNAMLYLYLLVFEELFCSDNFKYYLNQGIYKFNLSEFIKKNIK